MDSQSYEIKNCDVLVIGGGGSGTLASIEASKHKSLKVILACKGPIGQSGLTPTANGGTRAVGSPQDIFNEAITSGRFLNDQTIMWHMVSQIQDSLQALSQLGITAMPLSPKTLCVPGAITLQKLRDVARGVPNLELLEDVLITSLISSDEKISGATALDLSTGDFFLIQATTVVIATGGFVGELYPHSSNNPFGVTTGASGTGHIMSYLAGAELIDMEMIQFVPLPANPQCLHLRYYPEFWIGPYLNRLGEVVESDINSYVGAAYSPVLVQKFFRESEQGNGPIYIDHGGIEGSVPYSAVEAWDKRRKLLTLLGIDPSQNKIEIIIGSHFGMGGIRVNEKTETTLPGLYAAGEIMGGVHGALRIQGFSFTQMIVFGFEAGRQAADYAIENKKTYRLSDPCIEQEEERVFRFLEPQNDPVRLTELRKQLQQVMEEYVFIVRDKTGLTNAISRIKTIKKDVSRIDVPNFKRFNIEWVKAIEFSLLIEAAEIVAESALAREESRGCHYRSDFPEEDNHNWLKHTVASFERERLRIYTAPVVLNRIKPEN
ncbi:FAD-binding protein [Chloroflexota bacterium]